MSCLAFPSDDNSDGDDEHAVDDVLEDDKVRKQAPMCFISRHHPPRLSRIHGEDDDDDSKEGDC